MVGIILSPGDTTVNQARRVPALMEWPILIGDFHGMSRGIKSSAGNNVVKDDRMFLGGGCYFSWFLDKQHLR